MLITISFVYFVKNIRERERDWRVKGKEWRQQTEERFCSQSAFLALISLSPSLSVSPSTFFNSFSSTRWSVTKIFKVLKFSHRFEFRFRFRILLKTKFTLTDHNNLLLAFFSLYSFIRIRILCFFLVHFSLIDQRICIHIYTHINNHQRRAVTHGEREKERYLRCRFVDRKPDESRIRIRIRSPEKKALLTLRLSLAVKPETTHSVSREGEREREPREEPATSYNLHLPPPPPHCQRFLLAAAR